MPKPNLYATRSAKDPQLLEAFTALLRRHLSLTLKNTFITKDDVFEVLSYAALTQTSLDAACQELAHAPSGNRLREVLMAGLPPLALLQRQLNTLLRAQLPPSVLKGKHAYELAMDLTLIPYHGQPASEVTEILRNAAKDGTTHFHGYATVSIVHHHRRYVVAVLFVSAGTKMVTLVRHLLDRVRKLGISIHLLLLDKGFYAGEVFRTLDRRHLSYIVPLRLGQQHELFHRRGSYRTHHTLQHAHGGAYTVSAVLLRRFKQTRKGKRKVWWLGYACGGWTRRLAFRQVMARYRLRFGIETSYRQMNQVRARTSTRSPLLRLLYVGLALVLINCYVALRTHLGTPPRRRGGAPVRPLTFARLMGELRRTIERRFGATPLRVYRLVTSFS